jgi:hypothetical protein
MRSGLRQSPVAGASGKSATLLDEGERDHLQEGCLRRWQPSMIDIATGRVTAWRLALYIGVGKGTLSRGDGVPGVAASCAARTVSRAESSAALLLSTAVSKSPRAPTTSPTQ